MQDKSFDALAVLKVSYIKIRKHTFLFRLL